VNEDPPSPISLLTVYLPVLVGACTRMYRKADKPTGAHVMSKIRQAQNFLFFWECVRWNLGIISALLFFLQQVKQDDKPTSKMSFH
jgi:hypothetical protein